jgi:hypothetical protein
VTELEQPDPLMKCSSQPHDVIIRQAKA